MKRLVKHRVVIKAQVRMSLQSHWENRRGCGPEGRCSVCILVFMVCCYFSFSFTICFLLFFPSPFSDFEIYTLAMWAVQRTGFWSGIDNLLVGVIYGWRGLQWPLLSVLLRFNYQRTYCSPSFTPVSCKDLSARSAKQRAFQTWEWHSIWKISG